MNATNSTDSVDDAEGGVLYVAVFAIWPLICAWIAVVNIFVTVMTFANKQLRVDPHCAIISGLSISDGAVGLFGFGLVASVATGGIESEFWCISVYLCVYAVYFVSCLQILLVCIERILSIKYPLQVYVQGWFSLRRNTTYIVLIWIFAFSVFSIPFFLWYKTGKTDICIVHKMFEPRLGLHYFVSAGGILTYIAIMIAFSILIYEFRGLTQRSVMNEQYTSKAKTESASRAQNKRTGVNGGQTTWYMNDLNKNQTAETETPDNVTLSNVTEELKVTRSRQMPIETAGRSKELKGVSSTRRTTREAMRVLTVIIIALTFTVPVGSLAGIIPRMTMSEEWDSSLNGRRRRLLLIYISLVNSGINPLIYAFGMRKFRVAVKNTYKKLSTRVKCKTTSGGKGNSITPQTSESNQ